MLGQADRHQTLLAVAAATGDRIVVAEDHYPAAGLGSAVLAAFNEAGHPVRVSHLAVRDLPGSGTPAELTAAAGSRPTRSPRPPGTSSAAQATNGTSTARETMAEGRVQVRRVYEEPEPEDGTRVLVDRIWPRGLTRAKAALNEWCKDVAPSDELRK